MKLPACCLRALSALQLRSYNAWSKVVLKRTPNSNFRMQRNKNWRVLYRKISELLLREWDPIGIQTSTECKDEYDAYAAQVFSRLMQGQSGADIVDYLQKVAVEQLGLPAPPRPKTESLVHKLVS